MKTSEKNNMHNHAGLRRPDPLHLGTMETQKGTTKGAHQLLRAIY